MLNFTSKTTTPLSSSTQDNDIDKAKIEKATLPITNPGEMDKKSESDELIWFGPSPPDVHQPPMMFSPSPLRPMTSNIKIGGNDHARIHLSAFGGHTPSPDGLAADTGAPDLRQITDDDDEILPFTPGTPLKMKGWSALVDTPSCGKAEQNNGFYNPYGGIESPEDDGQPIPFDEETFGRKDTFRDLVERAGHAAVRRRKAS
ncbi:hypothetical protein I302_107530 [Kwoniella bestiolae CBS 10118]|uniref:Uncharacterized protein n=1 Tax=Kwoniella bestiolae CBS 10118 TaxID=1296100 RepID=A0A1B9FYA5_9TREE|nr:hypothetical protein I302_06729 [Kwoniella bestiolae CBS 10118]OCF23745.1 hypothetical protein I302_06729 [Kwoniella bestiolae CBS 10118]